MLAAVCAACMSACAPTVPVVKPKTVTVTKYVQVPVPDSLIAACTYVEPDPACWRDKHHVYCNGQLRDMLDAYRVTLAQCRAGVEALRDSQE